MKEDLSYQLPKGWVWSSLREITIPVGKANRYYENPTDIIKYVDIESIDNKKQIIVDS
jgi:imidazole glycerol phosphate synthase subunit HisF